MINKKTYILLFFLISIVYIAGIFLPLLENDSAQFGGMAFRMFEKNDFWNIYKNGTDYLDKPHLHFWLSALSFKLFGVHDWAYRIPSILFSILGAWSTYKLGKLLYSVEVGRLSSLILVTSQAFILANHDVRTDAVLLGATIFGIWGLVEYIKGGNLKYIILGATGVALAFSTKGQIAILVVGIAILCYLLYERNWKVLWSWKVLIGILVFFIVSTPMLYAYYQQFDLHPEKIVNGRTGVSGIWFIFWDQSFERLTGTRHNANNNEYLFFFHTFLWAFLPWSIIAVIAVVNRAAKFVKIKFNKLPGYEFLTIGGIIVIFSIISFSQFKLPHYINILFPLFAILTASYLYHLHQKENVKVLKIIFIIQMVVFGIVLILLSILSFWVFPIDSIWLSLVYAALLTLLFVIILKKQELYGKIISSTVVLAVLLNFVLNTNFYPKLFRYQAGNQLVKLAKKQHFNLTNVYMFNNNHSKSFDFYSQRFNPSIALKGVKKKMITGEKMVLFANENDLKLLEKKGISWKREINTPHFHISMVTPQFLNPSTRDETLTQIYLLEIN